MNRLMPLALTAMLALPARPQSAPPAAATIEADALIARLARPAPATVAFTEVRFSTLLREPAVLSGELGYSGPASLDRTVTEPYREKTAIRGESVRVEREGEASRSFGLKRAPELRGLLTGFTALLTGDAAALRKSFDVRAQGSDRAWTIRLTPADTRARQRLQQIVVNGRSNEPRCFSLINGEGGASVMMLGEAAGTAVPKSATLESVLDLCATE